MSAGAEGNPLDVEATVTDEQAKTTVRRQARRPTTGRSQLGHEQLTFFIKRAGLKNCGNLGILDPCDIDGMQILVAMSVSDSEERLLIQPVRVPKDSCAHWGMVMQQRGKIFIWDSYESGDWSELVEERLKTDGAQAVEIYIIKAGQQRDNFSCGYFVLWWIT